MTDLTYTRLGKDDEWLIGCQGTDKFNIFHYAIIRDGHILVQDQFDIQPGECLADRMNMALVEWKRRPRTWHRLFHIAARKVNPKLPTTVECRGQCPWLAERSQLEALAYTWGNTVPKEQRRLGNRVFLKWEKPPAVVHEG